MSATMIERAARAAAEQYGEDWEKLPDVNPIANGEPDKDMYRSMMLAAFGAMREPTPRMEGDGAFQIFRGEQITEEDKAGARRVWRAMLKAAADGGPGWLKA